MHAHANFNVLKLFNCSVQIMKQKHFQITAFRAKFYNIANMGLNEDSRYRALNKTACEAYYIIILYGLTFKFTFKSNS